MIINTGKAFLKLNHKPHRYGFIDSQGNITFFINDGEYEINNPSEGLKELLFNDEDHINLELVDHGDMAKYINILKAMGLNPGRSKRFMNISEKFKNDPILGTELLTLKGGEGLNNEVPVDLTNKNPIQLFHELSLLLAAKQAGNKNTLGKASIILDHLKNTKSISEKKYDKMLSKFIN